jgi:hypothetical protein
MDPDTQKIGIAVSITLPAITHNDPSEVLMKQAVRQNNVPIL